MKTNPKLLLFTIAALLLSACGGNTDVTPTEDVSIADVYTAAAMTLTAQANFATPTFTLLPSTTPTIWASPTTMPSTPTWQSVTPYSSSSYSTAFGCYDAVYVSDVTVPDGTYLAPSEEFVKTWKFRNTGSCDWTEDFLIIFSSGEDMDGNSTDIDKDVTAGNTASISVTLVAPEDEGSYTGYWKLATEDGTVFGEAVYVLIVVSNDASTATPTATTTVTSTTAATAISTSTSTPVPTSTNTPMPTNTTDASYPNP